MGEGCGRGFGDRGGFDVALFVGLDGFAHLDFFGVAFFGVEFGAETGEGAGGLGGFVGGAGEAFAGSFVVVEAGGRGGLVVEGEEMRGWRYRFPCCFCHRSMYSF